MQYIKELAKQGFLVEPNVVERLEKISSDDFNTLLTELKKQNLFVINPSLLNKIFKPKTNFIKQFETKTKFSMQDYVKLLSKRYDFIQQILMKKVELTNFLSINKIGLGKVGTIGFVKDKFEKGDNFILTIEDPTGEIPVVVAKNLAEKINLDDVIAVSGNINNKIFFAERILFPDIPIREVNYSTEPIKVAFTEKEVDADFLITKDKIINLANNSTQNFTEPTLIEIQNIIILIAFYYDPLEILKKRFIHKQNNDFLIDPIPDIVFNNKGININYKSVSIIPENVLVDLSTRETTFL